MDDLSRHTVDLPQVDSLIFLVIFLKLILHELQILHELHDKTKPEERNRVKDFAKV